jgi:hypothetical protein
MWPVASALHNLHELPYERLETTDDQVLLADSEDNLQLLHSLNKIAKSCDMEISYGKTKALAFRGKDPVPSTICLNSKLLEINELYIIYTVHFSNKLFIPTNALHYL